MERWINEAVFYHIYPIGFCNAPSENNLQDTNRINRIKKIEDWIPHLKQIGVNAIYFGPLCESSSHGYDTADYYWIDRRLGSNIDFKDVADQLHAAGIRIVFDGVFNHVGREFWAFKDVQSHGEHSQYISWFQNLNFGGKSPYGDDFWYEAWEGHYNLVKLNLRNPEVIEHILGAVGTWIDQFDIDGLRLDVAYCMDIDFLKTLRRFCENKKPDFWLLGEMIHGDYSRIANKEMLHAATNYESYKGIYSSHNDKNYFEINHSLSRLFGTGGIYKDLCLYNFIDNHDVNRIASTLKNPEHIYNTYTLLFTIPGVPSIYYGSEWGIKGIKEHGSDLALRPSLELSQFDDSQSELVKHIEKIASIRKQSKPVKYGTYEQVIVKNEQLIFKRTFQDEVVFIALNLSNEENILNFNVPYASYAKDLLKDKAYEIHNNQIAVTVAPCSSMVLTLVNE